MMIRKETDPEFVNRIVNDASVRPFIDARGIEGALDLSPAVGRIGLTGVVWLSNGKDALAAFEITTTGIYQAHLLFLKSCRGRAAIDAAKEMLAWMFDHGATIVWGGIDRTHRAACMFGRLIGARIIGGDEETAIFEAKRA